MKAKDVQPGDQLLTIAGEVVYTVEARHEHRGKVWLDVRFNDGGYAEREFDFHQETPLVRPVVPQQRRRRPDTSTIINHGQRLILNRGGMAEIAVAADQQMRTQKDPYGYAYAGGVRDILDWLAGEKPSTTLIHMFDLDPS